jgi:hypothetical protein
MPGILGNVNSVTATFVTQDIGLNDFTIVIISRNPDFSFQYNEGFVFIRMVVHRNLGARLKCIEKPVTLVIKTLMKVVVLS